jgi:DNA-binding MarR family transcriptional regulator
MAAEDYASQFADLIRKVIRIRQRFRAVMPEDVARARTKIRDMLPQPLRMDAADYDLLYRVGSLIGECDRPMTMGELASVADVPLSTATRLVDTLVDNGFAERLSDPDDRRVVRVQFSPTGAELYNALDELIQRRITSILRDFTDKECQALLHLSHKVLDALMDETS